MPTQTSLNKIPIFVVLGILLSLVLVTAFYSHYDLDLKVASLFYNTEQGWPYTEAQPWKAIYDYGPAPGLLLILFSGIASILCFQVKRWYSLRLHFLTIALTGIVVGGIFINAILKDYWGRPRPRQVEAFGGKWSYHEVYEPGTPAKGKAFVCGHCTIAYLFVSTAVFYNKARWLAIFGTLFGLAFGGLMSVVRIIQGGHFVTDTLWAFGIVVIGTISFYYWIFNIPKYANKLPSEIPWQRKLSKRALYAVLITLAIIQFVMRRPVYEDHFHNLSLEPSHEIHIQITDQRPLSWLPLDWWDDTSRNPPIPISIKDVSLEFFDHPVGKIQTIIQGSGWPEVRHDVKIQRIQDDQRFLLNYHIQPKGRFAKKQLSIHIKLPEKLRGHVFWNGFRLGSNKQ